MLRFRKKYAPDRVSAATQKSARDRTARRARLLRAKRQRAADAELNAVFGEARALRLRALADASGDAEDDRRATFAEGRATRLRTIADDLAAGLP